MRTALLAVTLLLVACGASSTEPAPEPAECEPMPWCQAFEDDVVRDTLIPLPTDSVTH